MELGQTKQRVDDLYFFLYSRPIHPELFQIYQVKRVKQKRYEAEIWIVGLAHVVTVQLRDQVITELISPESELLPKMGLTTSFRFRGERDHMESFDKEVRYIMSSQVEKMTPNLFPSSHDELLRYGAKRGVFSTFDKWEAEGLVPFSFVDFEPREKELHVQAFHVFPEDLTVLKTQSIFEVGNSKPLAD